MSELFAQRYLRHPDLFPRRLSGEPCGTAGLSIDFVGGPFVVAGLSDWQQVVVRRLWGSLCREPSADERPGIRVFSAAPSDFLAHDLRGEAMSLDFDYQEQRIDIAGQHLLGVVQVHRGALGAAALWSAADDEQEFAGIFENFFRVVVAYRLLDLGGVLLHSAAVVDREEAFVFVGHSGAGKSTLARVSLAGGRRVLSDDLNALVPGSALPAASGNPALAGFMVERVPFAGDLRRPESKRETVPLGGIALLRKRGRHEVAPVSAAQALAALLTAAPFVNADPWRAGRLEQILLTLCGGGRSADDRGDSGRMFALGFHPHDDRFWESIRTYVDGGDGERPLRTPIVVG